MLELLTRDKEIFAPVALTSANRFVVYEIEKSSPETNRRNSSIRLDLPEPDGPEMMKTTLYVVPPPFRERFY